jgi:hypothetical protein
MRIFIHIWMLLVTAPKVNRNLTFNDKYLQHIRAKTHFEKYSESDKINKIVVMCHCNEIEIELLVL